MLSHLANVASSTKLHTLCPVNNGGSTSSGDSIIVSFPEPSDSADACLGEEMHGKVTQALLSDHHIRLVLDDLCADLLDVVFLQFQQRSPANAYLKAMYFFTHILPLEPLVVSKSSMAVPALPKSLCPPQTSWPSQEFALQ